MGEYNTNDYVLIKSFYDIKRNNYQIEKCTNMQNQIF